jgi:hypothetical protein
MSLNGLDVPEVQQAYEATLSEAAGWFLVKYISRDEVALLGSGQAGLSEARNEILQYEELSPLYGLVVYRRRKVLVKYVPEGTSRLLQGTELFRRRSRSRTDRERCSADNGTPPGGPGQMGAVRDDARD